MEISGIMALILKNEDGSIREALLINEKGYRKSLENNEIWCLHDETGRLLPYEGVSLIEIKKIGNWVEAVVIGTDSVIKKRTPEVIIHSDFEKDITADMGTDILFRLERIIKQRHVEMPAGSYTTHLFEKGIEKIRKKTGEEAVELILARERSEIILELADFLYHVLVLLEAEGIGLSEVFRELEKRE